MTPAIPPPTIGGWHCWVSEMGGINNHHAYPVSARHGLKWHVIHCTWYAICILKQFGFVAQIHRGEWSAGNHAAKSLAAFER